jgi:hypothetical protein
MALAFHIGGDTEVLRRAQAAARFLVAGNMIALANGHYAETTQNGRRLR